MRERDFIKQNMIQLNIKEDIIQNSGKAAEIGQITMEKTPLGEKIITLVYKSHMEEKNNPLSPHLQIYRWQVSSLVSITHRITGILNLLGLIFICAWISSAGIGENLFECFSTFLKSFIGLFFGYFYRISQIFFVLTYLVRFVILDPFLAKP